VTFRVSSKKTTGITEEWPCCSALVDPYFSCSDNPPNCANDGGRIKIATIDIISPEAVIEGITANYIGYNIFVPTTSDLKLRLRMRDNVSGINSSYVSWTGANLFTGSGCSSTSPGSNTINCGNNTPYNTSFMARELSNSYINLSAIELTANVIDRAGNANETLYYITDHPFASPDSEDVFLFVGENYVLGLLVRNLLPSEQIISIQLSGYPLANFIGEGRSKTAVLKRGESTRMYIQINSEMPPSLEPVASVLNIEATSNVITSYVDATAIRITTGWPSSFSAFGEVAVIMSILLSLVIFARLAL
jgi:hypothetical protein